jgi:hypothetical protein
VTHSKTSSPPKGSGTKPIPGAGTDPSQVPTEAHGGNNSRNAPHPQGKDGNGAQKRQQKRQV